MHARRTFIATALTTATLAVVAGPALAFAQSEGANPQLDGSRSSTGSPRTRGRAGRASLAPTDAAQPSPIRSSGSPSSRGHARRRQQADDQPATALRVAPTEGAIAPAAFSRGARASELR
jgi:hypothetical protein